MLACVFISYPYWGNWGRNSGERLPRHRIEDSGPATEAPGSCCADGVAAVTGAGTGPHYCTASPRLCAQLRILGLLKKVTLQYHNRAMMTKTKIATTTKKNAIENEENNSNVKTAMVMMATTAPKRQVNRSLIEGLV